MCKLEPTSLFFHLVDMKKENLGVRYEFSLTKTSFWSIACIFQKKSSKPINDDNNVTYLLVSIRIDGVSNLYQLVHTYIC